MKRLLLLLLLLMTGFILTSCEEGYDFDSIKDQVDLSIESIDSLHEKIDALEAQLEALDEDMTSMRSALESEIAALQEALEAQMTTYITIAHTNDIHGRVVRGSGMGLANVRTVFDVLKARNPNTVLVDAGDTFHGNLFANIEEGLSVVELMNMTGYALMAPGNHDFNYGQARLLELRDYANFQFISANVYYEDGSRMFNPYMFMEIDGVTIAFIGLTSPETVYKTHPDNVADLTFTDPVEETQAVMDEIEGMADLYIVVAHVGTADDTEVTTIDVANQVDGIHIIIDGHSHDEPADNQMVNDTWIVSAGEYTQYVGYVDIIIADGVVVSIEPHYVDMAQAALYGNDQVMLDYVAERQALHDELLGEVIGHTTVFLQGDRAHVRTGETNLGNLLTDAMVHTSDADLAITNGGGIRDSIEIGDITLGDVISVLPFGNMVITKALTGAEIVDVLNTVTASFTGDNQIGSFPHVSGLHYTIDLSLNEDRIIDVMINGEPIDLDETYIVATNDFIGAGGDGYPHMADRPMISEFGTLDAALIDFITFLDDLDDYADVEGRITIIE